MLIYKGKRRGLFVVCGVLGLLRLTGMLSASELNQAGHRKPTDEADLRYWMQNMVWYHDFTAEEIKAATGLDDQRISDALKILGRNGRPEHTIDAPLVVMPYPGGRHPRVGFLEGAIEPQRETKVSVFTPWEEKSYVVVDVPEAIWSNLGLTYLAHTHVPTVWTRQDVRLDPLEWNRRADGTFDIQRTLPNGIVFGTKIKPARDAVHMQMWLTNGTTQKLTGLRVQNCVMLKAARGFEQQTNDNKVFAPPYVAVQSDTGDRWIITAWEPFHNTRANPQCPCLHSDPKFPDCASGETRWLRGWLSFHEGTDVHEEFRRLDASRWRSAVD